MLDKYRYNIVVLYKSQTQIIILNHAEFVKTAGLIILYFHIAYRDRVRSLSPYRIRS